MSRRLFYIGGTIPRARGLYPIGHYAAKVLFPDYILPVDPSEATCSHSHQGGRVMPFRSPILYPDKIGQQTRILQYDWAVRNDGIGGGVILNYTSSETAVAFRVANFDGIIHAETITGSGTSIKLAYYGVLAINGLKFDGTGDTEEVRPSDYPDYFDILLYSDGTNIHCYFNGEYKGFVPTTIKNVSYFIYSGNPDLNFNTKGNHFDYRIYDVSQRTPEEINAYFSEVGCLWHTDNMPDDPNFPYIKPAHLAISSVGLARA